EEELQKRAHRFSKEQKNLLTEKINEKGTLYLNKEEVKDVAMKAEMSYLQVKKFLANKRARSHKKQKN
ncbi:MAG: hypothetical protein MHPSP_001909, partial [Paramarteilia canceri]